MTSPLTGRMGTAAHQHDIPDRHRPATATNYSNSNISPSTVQDRSISTSRSPVSTLGDDTRTATSTTTPLPHLIPGIILRGHNIDRDSRVHGGKTRGGATAHPTGTVNLTWDQYQKYLGEAQVRDDPDATPRLAEPKRAVPPYVVRMLIVSLPASDSTSSSNLLCLRGHHARLRLGSMTKLTRRG